MLQVYEQKAHYFDYVLQSKNLIPITQIAKDYGYTAQKMNLLLHELGIQYKFRDTWLLYKKYADKGYTQTQTVLINSECSYIHTYWTQAGRLFIYERLKAVGILPLSERVEQTCMTSY